MINEVIRDIFTLQFVPCHRKKERSLIIRGKQFPLCYRCMAILLGYLFLPFLLFIDFSFPLWLAIVLNFPMVIDGTLQRIGVHTSTNFLRLWTGLICGLGQSMIVAYVSRFLFDILMQ
ncbi:DUF2085 domain-containing protein [Bacillus sp. DNRA2]|nr:DUF2085 domain-containing protein [Bacillus sp. DNRA2]